MSELMHYGTPRHSGRYPWGSGEHPYQRYSGWMGYVKQLEEEGLSEKEIADSMEMTVQQLRNERTIAVAAIRQGNIDMAWRLKEKGYSNTAIGERMGVNESTVRGWLNPRTKANNDVIYSTAEMLKKSIDEKKYIDVGVGVENHLGISRTKMKAVVQMLEAEGYTLHKLKVYQVGTGKQTQMMALTKGDVPFSEVAKNKDMIQLPTDYTEDGGITWKSLEPPRSVSSDRIFVRYGDEGGSERDGLIELRRGVEDISLGDARYAQVRIAVDDTHYLKGMAMYSDDLPDGIDIIFNTNKSKSSISTKLDAFKKMKTDPDNPFGASIKDDDELILAQRHYVDKNGKTQLSCLNIVSEEGNWSKWSSSISSQMLSKQSPSLAQKQLGIFYDKKEREFNEIMKLDNAVVREHFLSSFADECDSAASHLDAAGLPRQRWNVILPFPDMKENEIYAPNFRDGEHVALIRYPHGGTFEIPELTVNNKHPGAKRAIPQALDAVGINSKVAERLSGADFDGDTVLVIPTGTTKIKTKSPLKGLENFDPKAEYPKYEGMKVMTSHQKGVEMGKVSNLITDMTIKGATDDEICRAVRHSMVVIDAEKHELNWKQSALDNGIRDLQEKYQGGGGVSTIISRAGAEVYIDKRKEITSRSSMTSEERTRYDKGEKIYRPSGEISKKTGKPKQEKVTRMSLVEDARELSSGYQMEEVYAEHANRLKTLAKKARAEARATTYQPYSPTAAKTYAKEVDSLKSQLNLAKRNKPLERRAQAVANKIIATQKANNPGLSGADLKKVKGRALDTARKRMGAKKRMIQISDREWEAIQAGAVTKNTLKEILNNTDLDSVKQRATPHTTVAMTPAKIAKAKALLANGYTQAEVADAIGVSVTTLIRSI